MAYVAILFLLMVASALALAFTYDVGTQLSLLGDRQSAMQAGYLAESAANHAMWRSLGAAPVMSTVAASADDAEQEFSGKAVINSDKLRLGEFQFVGLRFNDVRLPRGAKILNAKLEFVAETSKSDATSLIVWAEASDDAAAFSAVDGDLSKRPRTSGSVGWRKVEVMAGDQTYRSPSLRFVVQEVVNRGGWSSGNALVLLIESLDSGGKRYVKAFDKYPDQAPKLIVNYQRATDSFDEDTYYLHSLAGGRYGYKIREQTPETFATVATVGAIDGVEVHQSYVLRVLPDEYALSPCLAGWWALDEGSGLTAADGSDGGNDGALVNMLGDEWTAGVVNGALDLARSNDYVDLGTDSAFDVSTQVTVAMWVRPSVSQSSMLFDHGYQSSYYVYLWSDGRFKLACAVSGSYWEISSSPGSVVPGEWMHLAATYDRDAGVGVLYVNGTEVQRQTSMTGSLPAGSQNTTIGTDTYGYGYNFDGQLDDVRLYACALSADEISAVYCAGAAPTVQAGGDEDVFLYGGALTLSGAVLDPCAVGALTTTWSLTSGPATVDFADQHAVDTTVTFKQEGEYVLRLTATTDTQTVFDEVAFTVIADLYAESFETWDLGTTDTWLPVDLSLSPFDVPAGAVVEVAITNRKADAALWGGVRAVGSSLERRVQLHEAESGGVDVVSMHVQADASSRIECYSSHSGDIDFVLLGYWNRGAYVERFDRFEASASGVWQARGLGAFGVGAGGVAEVLISNQNIGAQVQGGVQPPGFGDRRVALHEAEEAGVDAVTMMVNADSSAEIEVYAGDATSIRFDLLGYWSTPPGTFTEHFSNTGTPAIDNGWYANALSAHGVPGHATASMVLSNRENTSKERLGVRSSDSTYDRRFQLQEAEAGGDDLAALHVKADASGAIQWFREHDTVESRFYLLGWWTP